MKWIYFLIIVYSFMACFSDTKKVKEYYEDEKTLRKEYFVHKETNLKEGSYISYYEDGTVYDRSTYKNGKLDGNRKIYFPTGEIQIEEPYIEDQIHGEYLRYHKNGTVEFRAVYVNHVLNGTAIRYYNNGQIKDQVTMVQNQENGPFVEYYKNGNKKWEGTYKDGDNEVDLLIQYDSLGQMEQKLMCDSLSRCKTFWTRTND